MSRRRPAPPLHPLLSPNSITFLASWRGQLLICTVVIILGGLYFIIRGPILSLRRRRREKQSRAREGELLSMIEQKESEPEAVGGTVGGAGGEDDKRGRRKIGEGRKRKNTLLRTVNAAAVASASTNGGDSTPGPSSSSIESSPAPFRSSLSTPKSNRKPLQQVIPPPQLQICPQHPSASISHSTAYGIPLPDSPGPSRLVLPKSNSINLESEASVDGDGCESAVEAQSTLNGQARADGWSVMPEDGYLPVSAAPPSSKKKKRKGKSPNPNSNPSIPPPLPLQLLKSPELTTPLSINTSKSTPTSTSNYNPPLTTEDSPSPLPFRPPQTPRTPSSRHARKASLTRPLNTEYEQLLDERDRMIESLRADIGLAKAKEARAVEELGAVRGLEEKGREKVERVRNGGLRGVEEGRKREMELQSKLSQLSALYIATSHRLTALETLFRDSGGILPPPLSPLPPPHFHQQQQQHTPNYLSLPLSNPTQNHFTHSHSPLPSPLPPTPSPRIQLQPGGAGGYINYPSPGMFLNGNGNGGIPSPMLHPPACYLHSPMTRALVPGGGGRHGDRNGHGRSGSGSGLNGNGNGDELLAGTLTPGLGVGVGVGVGKGGYLELGLSGIGGNMPLGSSSRLGNGNGAVGGGGGLGVGVGRVDAGMGELRRKSIESSVLKKKNVSGNGSGGSAGGGGSEGIVEIDEIEEVDGETEIEGSEIGSGSSIRDGSDIVPGGRGRGSVNGNGNLTPASPSPPNRGSMLLTPANAEVYRNPTHPDTGKSGQLGLKMRNGSTSNSSEGDGDGESGVGAGVGKEVVHVQVEPMFASLAHTPEQVEELRRMREGVVRRVSGV